MLGLNFAGTEHKAKKYANGLSGVLEQFIGASESPDFSAEPDYNPQEEVRNPAGTNADHAAEIEDKLKAIQGSSMEITNDIKDAVVFVNEQAQSTTGSKSTVDMLVKTYDALIDFIKFSINE